MESSSDRPSREWIKRATMNQYDNLQAEESATGSKTVFTTRSNNRKSKPFPRCSLCSRAGHTAKGCKEYIVTKRDQKTQGQRNVYNNDYVTDGRGYCGRKSKVITQCTTSVRVRTSPIVARMVWTLPPRQPPRVPCMARMSAPLTAILRLDHSRVLARVQP